MPSFDMAPLIGQFESFAPLAVGFGLAVAVVGVVVTITWFVVDVFVRRR